MHIIFVAFNFKGSDLAAEEKHYFDYHVALARSFPGVGLHMTGRFLAADGAKPARARGAILGFDSAEAGAAAFGTDAGRKVMADSEERFSDMRLEAFQAEAVAPFEKGKPGARRFVSAVAFDLKPGAGDRDTAERSYRARHVEMARKLPGLKGYLIGRLDGERQRIALMAFESAEKFRDAMSSPAGVEVNNDGLATAANLRFERLDARLEA